MGGFWDQIRSRVGQHLAQNLVSSLSSFLCPLFLHCRLRRSRGADPRLPVPDSVRMILHHPLPALATHTSECLESSKHFLPQGPCKYSFLCLDYLAPACFNTHSCFQSALQRHLLQEAFPSSDYTLLTPLICGIISLESPSLIC